MKIYALSDVMKWDHLGHYSNKYLAWLAAKDHYKKIEGISCTFSEYWDNHCHLDEITVVTEEDEE